MAARAAPEIVQEIRRLALKPDDVVMTGMATGDWMAVSRSAMNAQQCPLCGSLTLVDRAGGYRFEPPDRVPGGLMIVPHVSWQSCTTCGEDLLPRAITKSLEAEQQRRSGAALSVSH